MFCEKTREEKMVLKISAVVLTALMCSSHVYASSLSTSYGYGEDQKTISATTENGVFLTPRDAFILNQTWLNDLGNLSPDDAAAKIAAYVTNDETAQAVANALGNLDPFRAAQIIDSDNLTAQAAAKIFNQMTAQQVAGIIHQDVVMSDQQLCPISNLKAATILVAMDNKKAAAVLAALPSYRAAPILFAQDVNSAEPAVTNMKIISLLSAMSSDSAAAIVESACSVVSYSQLDGTVTGPIPARAGQIISKMTTSVSAAIFASNNMSARTAASIINEVKKVSPKKTDSILSAIDAINPVKAGQIRTMMTVQDLKNMTPEAAAQYLSGLDSTEAAALLKVFIGDFYANVNAAAAIVAQMDPVKAANVLAELNTFDAAVIIGSSNISVETARNIFINMSVDKAAAILQVCDLAMEMTAEVLFPSFPMGGQAATLSSQKAADILSGMDPAAAATLIKAVIGYLDTNAINAAAAIVAKMDPDKAVGVFAQLNVSEAGMIIGSANMSAETAAKILNTIDSVKTAEILSAIDTQKAAQILNQMEVSKAAAILEKMDPVKAAVVKVAILTLVFGPQASSFTPVQVMQLYQLVVQVGGAQRAGEIVVELQDVFGADLINTVITSDFRMLSFVMKGVNNLGESGLTGFVSSAASVLGLSTETVTATLQANALDGFSLQTFVTVICSVQASAFEQVVQEMNGYFGEDIVREMFLNSPLGLISAAAEVNLMGAGSLEASLDALAQVLSLSDEMMMKLNATLSQDPEKIEKLFYALRDYGIESVISALSRWNSLFGSDPGGDNPIARFFADNPSQVIWQTMEIDSVCPGGIEGLPVVFDKIANAFGVSAEEVAQTLASRGNQDDLLDILVLMYGGDGNSSAIGEEQFLQVVAEIVTMYGKDAAFSCFSQQIITFISAVRVINQMGGLQGVVNELSASNPEWQVIYTLQDIGIAAITRFMPEDLKEVVQNRITNADDGRPLAVIIGTEDDGSGYFSSDTDIHHQLIEAGFRVMYYEAATDTDLMVSLENATKDGANPARLIIISGHGSQTGISMGSDGGEEGDIDFSDYSQFTGINDFLETGGTVILNSCSTGEGMEKEANMANMFGQLFPGAAHVFAPTVPAGLGLIISPGNYVTGVIHYPNGFTYDAAGVTGFTFESMDPAVLELKVEAIYQEIK
jgi:flagellar motility protein MotE (MotC chaperone)